MITYSNRILISVGGFILLAVTACAVYFETPLLLLIPLVSLGAFYLVQHPAVLFYLLIFSIPWSAEFNFTESLGSDLPDEPLMLLTAFCSIGLFVYQWKKVMGGKWHLLTLLLLLQIAWLLITVILSTHFILSAKYFLAKGWYLLAFVAAPVLFGGDEKMIRRTALVLSGSMVTVTLIVLFRQAQVGFSFATINDCLKPFFRNHVTYSALLVFMVPLQIAFFQMTADKKWRQLIVICLIVTVAAIYLSYARGAWLAMFAGVIVYWLLRKRLLVKSFIVIIMLTVITVLWLKDNDRYLAFAHDYKTTIFHPDFEEHLAATYQMKDVSTAERFHRWIAGVRMIDDSWQTGFGPSTFYQHYKSYTVPAFKTWVSANKEHSTVHNYFLLLLIEQGAIGLLLFLLLTGAMFWYVQRIYNGTQNRFWKITAATVGAILMMQCTVNFLSDLIETDKIGSVFYLCVATLIIADRKTKECRTDEQGISKEEVKGKEQKNKAPRQS